MAAAGEENQDHLIMKQKEALDKEIADTIPLLGDKEELAVLEKEFGGDPLFLEKIKNLSATYSHIRRTRPDGNCFFRALGYRYFERLLKDRDEWQRFKDAITPTKDEMIKLGFPSFTLEDFYDNFMDALEKVGPADPMTEKELSKTFNDMGVSDYLVVFLRLLTSKKLQQEADFYQNFMEDGRTVVEFCNIEVEPMYHESDHIHITALCATTGIPCRVMYLDRGTQKEAVAHDFPDDKAPLVHLLYRPGHYDVLYPKEEQ